MTQDRGVQEEDEEPSAAMVVVGEQPRPRLLVIGFEDDPDLMERLGRLAPTVHAAGPPRAGEPGRVQPGRHRPVRFAVALGGDRLARCYAGAAHLSVVYRSNRTPGGTTRMFDRVVERDGAVAGEFEHPDDLPPAVRALVDDDLVPAA